jgi:hypothetical protein
MPYEALTKERLTRALRRLSELAADEGIVLEIDLYGGAVFTLVYGSRDSTRDVDAVIKPAAQGVRLVRKVATEQDLPEDWLNSEVQQFLSLHGQSRPFPAPELEPGIILSIPTANYLLALKLRASRPPLLGYPGDEPDIRYLLHKIKPASLEAVDAIFERFFPGDALHDYARSMVTRLLTEIPRTP